MIKLIKKLLGICDHKYQTILIFGGNPNTHNDVMSCYKCGKSQTIFSGTRREWYKRHNIKV